MSKLELKNVRKEFDTTVALDNVSLEIEDGEFFTLLGPSGCGKSTLLRTVAGFIQQNAGHVYVAGRLYDAIPPHKRNMGMVFQNYAIFPHMSVFDNIAYGLRALKMDKQHIRDRVEWGLSLVQLQGYAHRRPDQLSGGQKQRVVLARALVIEPQVLLMDEPLSNLDAKLRVQMRADIRKVQQELGITTIYVTHDQEEALAISDRIAVMKDGTVQQLGDPATIYENPQNQFVAEFIGSTNTIPATVKEGGQTTTVTADNGVTITTRPHRVESGQPVTLGIRPEDVQLHLMDETAADAALHADRENANETSVTNTDEDTDLNARATLAQRGAANKEAFMGTITLVSYLGAASSLEVAVEGLAQPIIVRLPNTRRLPLAVNDKVIVTLPAGKTKLFAAETGGLL